MRRISLGRIADISLERARERANELTSAARAGCDLIAEEAENQSVAASRLTIDRLIDIYVKRRVVGRLRTATEIESRLKRALSPLLDRYANEIGRRDVRQLLDAVADQGLKREAEKRRQAIGAMFRWAVSQDIVETDVTAGLSAYDPGTPRDRVLSAEEIEALWKWLDSGILPAGAADIMKLELLTGARCGEISGLCAEEIDRGEWIWRLPATRSKNKRPRVTPLVGVARQIIDARLSVSPVGPLFTAETGSTLTAAHIGHYLLSRRDKLPINRFTTHDLRRTMATKLVEMGVALDLVAAVVGHEAGGRESRTLVRHYVRTDLIERKVHALSARDLRLQDIVAGREAITIVRLLKTG
jgi:integrase